MLKAEQLKKRYDDMGECIGAKVREKLLEAGLTPEEIDKISEDLANINNEITDEDVEKSTEEANKKIEEAGEKLEEKAEEKAKMTAWQQQNQENIDKARNTNPQDSTDPVQFTEPPVVFTKYTTPKDDDKGVKSSFEDNYNASSGSIDSGNNWVKKDLQEKSIEMVHGFSGSFFKIDREGNVSIHIAGNLRLAIDKDATISIANNLDVGTGEGSIAISAAKLLSILSLEAMDVTSKGMMVESKDAMQIKSAKQLDITTEDIANIKSSKDMNMNGKVINLN